MESKKCEICENTFEYNKSYTNTKYCDKCTTNTCKICNEVFTIKPKAKRVKKYCSVECYYKSKKGKKQPKETVKKIAEANTGRKTGKYIECNFCKKLTYFQPYQIKKTKNNYCSNECFVNWSRSGFNDNWKGDKCPENKRLRRSFKYKQWRKKVQKRDNYQCVLCGYKSKGTKPADIHVDHIKPWSKYPKLRFDIDNGRVLCIPCHKKTDSYGKNLMKD